MHHAYSALFLGGRWVKVVPAFNRELCEKMNIVPTEFDGRNDAILQENHTDENLNMVYLKEHGYWSDVPFDRINADFRGYYPADFIGFEKIDTA
jgi:hypothetical protein